MKKIFELINQHIVSSTIQKIFSPLSDRKNLPLITISREKGSGGRPIAYLVAKQLGAKWHVYHKEILEKISSETHSSQEAVRQVDERKIPVIEGMIADFFGKRYLNLNTYYRSLLRALSEIGHKGYCVIIGRGANFLFPHGLKVRIICEMDQRIKWLMEYEHVSKKEAINRITRSDEERTEFAKTLFYHDSRKAHHYDLIVRTGKDLSIKDAADLIVKVAKKRFRI